MYHTGIARVWCQDIKNINSGMNQEMQDKRQEDCARLRKRANRRPIRNKERSGGGTFLGTKTKSETQRPCFWVNLKEIWSIGGRMSEKRSKNIWAITPSLETEILALGYFWSWFDFQQSFIILFPLRRTNYSNVGRLFCTPAPPKFTKKLAVDSFFNFGSWSKQK